MQASRATALLCAIAVFANFFVGLSRAPLFDVDEGAFSQAVRFGDWKAIRNTAGGPIELYDLSRDQSESNDLAASHPDAVAKAESPPLQAKLLRVTQHGLFTRVGSDRELETNARILAATNRNLEEAVKAGRFREDLFYRLNVVELNIPPLRERVEDILPLATAFIAEFTKGKARFSSGVTACLTSYGWPGNVRELRNAMEAPRCFHWET